MPVFVVAGPPSRQMAHYAAINSRLELSFIRERSVISRRACYVLKLPPHSASKPVHAQVPLVYHLSVANATPFFILFAAPSPCEYYEAIPHFATAPALPIMEVLNL